MIHFIPNDPEAGAAAPAMVQKKPSRNRPASRSGFAYADPSPQGIAEPGTAKFLFWQAREAAILAVGAWEAAAGPHKSWQGNRKKVALRQDAGVDLNAYYDRASFSFFHQEVEGRTFFSGASTDVVAHEVGHGLLDSVRPDLWDVNYLEAGAFHEAFGDCMAILTAIEDPSTRTRLLAQAPSLRSRNFVESTAEELSMAIGLVIPGHNAAEPRHAFNSFRYQLPSTLPFDGGPGELINEVHSFGMIFTGCFWDLIANLFAAGSQNEAGLLAAAHLAGSLLIAGAKEAVVTPRFIQSVGRAMTLADQTQNGGANHDAIRDAFGRHDVALGSNSLLAPTAVLAGAAPSRGALTAATRKDLMRRMGAASGAKLSTAPAKIFGADAVRAVRTRSVSLAAVHPSLKGAVALVHEPAVVGASGGRAAIMGALPHSVDTESETLAFVEVLVKNRRIETGKSGKGALASADHPRHTTHTIASVAGRKLLKRIRFRC